MTNQVIFAHIPKTAGTSFRVALAEQLPAERLLFDYGPKSNETSEIIKNAIYKGGPSSDLVALRQSNICFISGHFHDTKIRIDGYAKLFPQADIVTFVRDPIKRIISEFYHFRDNHNYEGEFDEFIRNPNFINRQNRALCGFALDSLAFIGLTEKYEESIAAFNRRYGMSVRCIWTNSRDVSKGDIEFSERDIEAFCKLNIQDIELYNHAVSRFWTNAKYPKAAMCDLPRFQFAVRRTEIGGVVGWVVDYDNHTPVTVVVVVEGRQVLSCPASLYRPDTIKAGLHRTGYCGFKIEREELALLVGGKKEFDVHVPGFGTIYNGALT